MFTTWTTVCGLLVFSVFSTTYVLSQDRHHWYRQAKSQLMKNLKGIDSSAVSRNTILFIGDGMGLTTVTAARIFRGQRQGKTGEEHELAFDKFQHVALAKTYSIDSQVCDSGSCATALLCGVKGRFETIGLDGGGHFNQCDTEEPSRIRCLVDWAQADGKWTGLVTTTRVTHATPAAMFAHTANRYWESDEKMTKETRHQCKDIARQMVEDQPGRNLHVILGGGRRHFLPSDDKSDDKMQSGRRKDKRDLIQEWKLDKKTRGLRYKYVSNQRELRKIDPSKVDYLLGLFSFGHMAFESDRDRSPDGEPSLAEMTKKAIQILRKNPDGYFLMVEGGRIDHSHHFNNAHRALVDTLALEDAVVAALDMTRRDETMIVVTSDHSQVFSFGGYPKRGNQILGLDSRLSDVDNMPYTTLLYANGPGYNHNFPGGRENLSSIDTADRNYVQQSAVPMRWDTHGGEDVPVYAEGPVAHVFRGVVEQTYIPHAIAYAACIGPQKSDCDRRKELYLHRRTIQCPSAQVDESSNAIDVVLTNNSRSLPFFSALAVTSAYAFVSLR